MAGVTAASIHALDPGVKLPLSICFKPSDSKGVLFILFIFNNYNLSMHGESPELHAALSWVLISAKRSAQLGTINIRVT